jgi:hypothetical protein
MKKLLLTEYDPKEVVLTESEVQELRVGLPSLRVEPSVNGG